MVELEEYKNDPRELRRRIRVSEFAGQTGGLAIGYVQANLVVLPAEFAKDFERYCFLNPKPCPLLGISEPGSSLLPSLGEDIDVHTDIPAYNIFKDGKFEQEANDISSFWQDDFVAFALGCSFSFEEALEAAGLEVRHNALGLVNPMYTTNIPTKPSGLFAGPHVVTMRPFSPKDAIRAIQITSRFPSVHGAPIHMGDPAAIGITDLAKSEFGGDAVPIHDGEIPLFWACGVTPQVAIKKAKPPICITHRPASMLITDLRNAELSVL